MAVKKKGLSGWAIAGIVLGGLAILGILLVVGLVSCVALLSASTNETPAPTKDPVESAIKITAEDLLAEYQDNEVAADNKYEGKILLVEGVVDNVGKDIFGDVYVTLGGPFENVQCTFDKQTEIDKVSELHPGDKIKVLGKCTGESITSPMMDDCSIVE